MQHNLIRIPLDCLGNCMYHREAQCCTGYSPLLTFQVDDLDTIIPRLIQHGAALDGPVKHQPYAKIAALRSPDGHMLGLYEPANLPDDGDTKTAAAAAAQAHLQQQTKDSDL